MLTYSKRLKKATDHNNGIRLAIREYLPKERQQKYEPLLVALQQELNEAIKLDVATKKLAKRAKAKKSKKPGRKAGRS